MASPHGLILYEGPSRLGADPIIAVVTGLSRPSSNRGTGWMSQLWILLRDKHPVDALRDGSDKCVCGDCSLRPRGRARTGRACYVQPMPIGSVYKAYHRGLFVPIGHKKGKMLEQIFDRLPLRVGAYGDPAALPVQIWENLLDKRIRSWTGYTSQWLNPANARLRPFFQASVKSESEYRKAKEMGWSTFRVRLASDPVFPEEFLCPKSEEAGKKTVCAMCLLCNGNKTSKKNPVIIAHGPPNKARVIEEALLQIRKKAA